MVTGTVIIGSMSIPELIGELVTRYGSLNAASRKADIPVTTLFKLYNGENKEPRLDTLRKIARGLDLSLSEVIDRLEADSDVCTADLT